MKWLIIIVLLELVWQYIKYQAKTNDKSIQGYVEYLKEKYYYKKKD